MGRKIDPDRLAAVEKALLAMESPSLIVRRLAYEWSCKPKTVHAYVLDVLQRWRQEESLLSIDDLRQRLTLMCIDTYREARATKNTKAALMCISEIAKLHGLTTSQASSVVNVYDQRGAFTSPQAITSRLRELRALEGDDDESNGGGGEHSN